MDKVDVSKEPHETMAEFTVLDQDDTLRSISSQMKSGTSAKDRGRAYSGMLQMCLIAAISQNK